MILYLEVQQIDPPAAGRDVLCARQEGLPALSTIGVELVIPANIRQSDWDVFFTGLPHASVIESDSLRPLAARVRVADEADARAAWKILKPWFDSAQVTIQLHEHVEGGSCETKDFNPEAEE